MVADGWLLDSEIAPELNVISQGSIVEHIYGALIALYEKYENASLRGRILQCLGLLIEFITLLQADCYQVSYSVLIPL